MTSSVRVYLNRILLACYRLFPLPAATKAAVAGWAFRTFPSVFRHTRVYARWLALDGAAGRSPEPRPARTSPRPRPTTGLAAAPGGPPLVIIHAYYTELLPEMLDLLAAWRQPYELHLTAPLSHERTVRGHLEHARLPGEVHVFDNRGRDILPFLRVARSLISGRDRLLLKLHTKRSLHRKDGEQWRHDLLEKLLAPDNVERIIEAMATDPGIGMVGPEGHVLLLASFWGANRANVEEKIARRLGVPVPDPQQQAFVAGSMFWARSAALRPLLDMPWEDDEFEPEAGQVDGTLAHAIERGFSLSLQHAGLRLTDTNDPWTEVSSGRRRYLHAASASDAPPRLPQDFDAERYLLANPDVSASGQDPAEHYLKLGWAEGRRW